MPCLFASSITGYDVDAQAAAHGVALGLLDSAAADAAQAVRDAELVVLAAPVGSIAGLFGQIVPLINQPLGTAMTTRGRGLKSVRCLAGGF